MLSNQIASLLSEFAKLHRLPYQNSIQTAPPLRVVNHCGSENPLHGIQHNARKTTSDKHFSLLIKIDIVEIKVRRQIFCSFS